MLKKIVKKIIPNQLRAHIKSKILRRFEVIQVTTPYLINITTEGIFKNKVVVITGGSGALGRAIAFKFAAQGAIVYVCGRNKSKLESLVTELSSIGKVAYSIILDVTSSESIIKMVEQIMIKHKSIDILVTSAGGSARENHTNLIDQNDNLIREIIDTNLIGTVLCAKYVAKVMKEQNSGKIVTISSSIGLQGKAGFSEYAASKGAVVSFTKSLAMELGIFGINVNCVSPGIIQRDSINYSKMEKIKSTNFLNNYGKPEDVADAVSFLASPSARFITGQNLLVDGGRTLGLKGD